MEKAQKKVTKPKKYTAKFVLGELEAMFQELLENEDIVYKGQLFIHRDYSRQRFSEWAKEYSDNQQISDAIKKIEEICEARLFGQALKNKVNPTVAIFGLKNNHKWKDSREITGDKDNPVSVSGFTFEVVTNDGTK